MPRVGAQVVLSQIKSPTVQQLGALGGQLGLSALMSGYSREFEDQADRVGLRYAYEAGFDVSKGPELWEKLGHRAVILAAELGNTGVFGQVGASYHPRRQLSSIRRSDGRQPRPQRMSRDDA